MRDDEFQKRLRPARRERLSERRKWIRARVREQSAALERTIDENTNAQIARERKYAICRVANANRIRELHEVRLLRAHDPLEISVRRRLVVRDADIAHTSLRLALPKGRDVCAPVDQIVDLHEIDARSPEQTHRVF